MVEYNPFEAIQTNVMGTQNVIDACLHEKVRIAVGVGTDKAVSPLNTYGATKLLMEKLFVTANYYTNPERHQTKFIALRYGNVLGSSGSVVPKFLQQIRAKEPITITDTEMTRYSLTMDEALDFILESTQSGKGSEIFVPKLRAYTISDLKDALFELLEDTGVKMIPIRAGEKMHEVLINEDEMRSTWETDSKYVIMNPITPEKDIEAKYPNLKKMETLSSYSSKNAEQISKEEIKKILQKAGLI